MNAGFVSKKREEQLWEVQRIITQLKVHSTHTLSFIIIDVEQFESLFSYYYFYFFFHIQRKLRSFERKADSMQKSIDDGIGDVDTSISYDATALLSKAKSVCSDDESQRTLTVVSIESNTDTKTSPQETPDKFLLSNTSFRNFDKIMAHEDTPNSISNLSDEFTVNEMGFLVLPETHPEYLNLLRLQLENNELVQWKQRLQRRIQSERAEITRLKAILSAKQQTTTNSMTTSHANHDIFNNLSDGNNYERIVAQFVLENTMLEQKKNFLAREIFEENQKLIQLQVELAVRQFQI